MKIYYVVQAFFWQFSSHSRPVQSSVLPADPTQMQLSTLPPPVSAVTEVRNFVAACARARKSWKDIKPLVDASYIDKALSISQIYCIIKTVKGGKNTLDQSNSSAKKMKRTGESLPPRMASL